MKAARWKAPGSTIALAALALVAALAAPPAAAEEPGALKVSCKGGQVSLEAHAASALHVFRALEEECGLQLKGGENIPDEPVTATYEKVALEDIIESLIHLLGLSSTLLAIDSSGALKLAVLSSGTPGPSRPRLGRTREERRRASKSGQGGVLKK